MSIREAQKQSTHQALLDATLRLSAQGRSFSSISLREITREVDLAPATFYRHFKNMDQLALELIDAIGIYLKNTFRKAIQLHIQTTEKQLDFLFTEVSKNFEYWSFFIRQRNSNTTIIRQAIQREIYFLIEECTTLFIHTTSFQHLQDPIKIILFSDMLVQLSFCWILEWLDLDHNFQHQERHRHQQQLKQKAEHQINILYSGLHTTA